MTKEERERLEHKSLFTDERYAKKAWKKFMSDSLESDAAILPELLDNKGNSSNDYLIYQTAYRSVEARLEEQGLSRKPMKAEVLVECNILRAAFDTSTFNVVLDRTAGKVKEELNIGVGAFEELSDDELEALAEHRAKKKSGELNG